MNSRCGLLKSGVQTAPTKLNTKGRTYKLLTRSSSSIEDEIAVVTFYPNAMDRYERITTLHRLLKSARYPVSVERLREASGASRSTLYRDLDFLRDALRAPLMSDTRGYFYAPAENERFELPGLWLSAEELHALLAARQLLARSGVGVLDEAIAPLQERIDALLDQQSGGQHWPINRVRLIPHRTRHQGEGSFRVVASALLSRQRLSFEYHARSTDAANRRHVSPQRLIHYRDNWYLDAWDHDREALRSFSVDRIRQAHTLDTVAIDMDEATLDTQLSDSYGIFSGTPHAWATIVFSAKSARWVADEHWHSQQQGRFLPDGRYELKVPYSTGRELLMDVLQYGADAEIIAPSALREQARSLLELALGNYRD